MLVHLGGDTMVEGDDIVAIIAFEVMQSAPANRVLLDWASDSRMVFEVEGSRARAVVICTDRVYLSPISPATLKQRVTRQAPG